MAAITLNSVEKHFDKTEVIKDISLEIKDGEFCVFVGPSGCGKSTLLRLIAGLEECSSGRIHFDEQDVTELTPAERGVAMVFQSYALYPHMTVYDNMAFGLKIAKTDSDSIKERVSQVAQTLQIEHLLKRKPRELSGGQRQRVAIGRAIVRKPRVFLFDEPLSNLDAALRVQMRLELKRLHRELGTTMIYVTHDQVEALTLADRIAVLNKGSMEQVGPPLDLYHQPRDVFVAGFIGSPQMNFVPARVLRTSNQQIDLALGSGQQLSLQRDGSQLVPSQPVTLGVRPEHLGRSNHSDGDIRGEVVAVEHLGTETYIHCHYGESDPLIIRCDPGSNLDLGESIGVNLPSTNHYLFDENGMLIN